MENARKRWGRESQKGEKATLKFGSRDWKTMMPLLDTGMSGRRASFAGMINSSGRDTVRPQEKNFLILRDCETMRKI